MDLSPKLPPIPFDAPPPAPVRGEQPRYRPPVGIPVGKSRRAGGWLVSLAIHLLLVLLLIVPFTSPELIREVMGAGGPGPAGGGGGGNRGTGGKPKTERVQFVNVAPPPKPSVIPPLVKPPEIKPIVPPPVVPPPTPAPTPPTPAPPSTDAAEAKSNTAGSGGGSGSDGSAGSGPGSGGGVGSGIGTGRGSAVGPGTGGGPGTIYPPAPFEVILPPMPIPRGVKGDLVVVFDVDSTGKVIDFQFTPTKDSGYNRRLREAFAAVRFRPATNGLGVPVRAKFELTYTL